MRAVTTLAKADLHLTDAMRPATLVELAARYGLPTAAPVPFDIQCAGLCVPMMRYATRSARP
jgi:hypothetical protein